MKVRKGTVTENFDRLADLEAEMDVYERHRLLYVACTRARDHLIVCTHHDGKSASYGEKLADCSADVEDTLCRRLPAPNPGPRPRPSRPAPASATTTTAMRGASDERPCWLPSGRRASSPPPAVAALATADEAVDDPESSRDEAAATDVRRSPAAGVEPARPSAGPCTPRCSSSTSPPASTSSELAAQQAHLEAVPDAVDTIEQMARSALRAPSVLEAVAGGRLWREVYVAAPVGDRAIEGYIDLLYETDDGLVIVDYKTDTIRSEAEIDAKLDQYRLQLAAYAVALEASTGLTVTDARLVFCTTGDPIERAVTDLAAGTAEVRSRLGTTPAHGQYRVGREPPRVP